MARLASKLQVEGHKDNRKGRGEGVSKAQGAWLSLGCLVDRWRNGQVHELPFLPAFPANKTIISSKHFNLGIETFINSELIF